MKQRKYLLLTDFTTAGVSALSENLNRNLMEWTNRQPRKWPPAKEPIPLILAGCGQWARNRTILPLFQKRNQEMFKIVAVTTLERNEDEFEDTVKMALEEVGAGDTKFFRRLNQAIDFLKSEPAAVAVNTPNGLHEELADTALFRDCHVYAERPINRMGDDLPGLLRRAGEKGLYLYTGTQRRLEFPYRYMRMVLQEHKNFGELESIRCTLASGRRCPDWRRNYRLAGGGVVTDEGYHLLDTAIWLTQVCNPGILNLRREDVQGWVKFRYKEVGDWERIETSAFGRVTLPGNVLLQFDLSYAVPEGSVFECLELRDESGGRLRLMRDQVVRSSIRGIRAEPGRILHQDSKGNVINDGFSRIDDQRTFHFDRESSESVKADDTRPLLQFLKKVRSGHYEPEETLIAGENDCDARFVLCTQELISGIYMLGDKDPEEGWYGRK